MHFLSATPHKMQQNKKELRNDAINNVDSVLVGESKQTNEQLIFDHHLTRHKLLPHRGKKKTQGTE